MQNMSIYISILKSNSHNMMTLIFTFSTNNLLFEQNVFPEQVPVQYKHKFINTVIRPCMFNCINMYHMYNTFKDLSLV